MLHRLEILGKWRSVLVCAAQSVACVPESDCDRKVVVRPLRAAPSLETRVC